MMKTQTRRHLALVGTAVALSVALSGCSAISGLLGGGDAARDDDGQVIEGSNIDIFSLKVGDCKMEDASGQISDTDVVPCAEPHDEEVYFEFSMDDGDFPGQDAIDEAALEQCHTEFESYVDVVWDESTLDYSWISPTEETWNGYNDRVVQCVLYSYEGEKLEGSMKGAAV